MGNLDIYEQVREVPKEAQKTITGGRMNGKTDINPMWRIKKLTELFGPCGIGWYYTPIRKWTEPYGEEVAAFVDIELFVKYEEDWSKPIPGTGGSMFVAKEKSGHYVSDECYKMATTDAISVACKQLGIGADIYWQADKTKYANVDHSQTNTYSKSNREQLIQEFENEVIRTGANRNWFLEDSKVSEPKYFKTDMLKAYIERLKAYPDKGVS